MAKKRREIVLDGPVGVEITVDGRHCLYFGGTDYLGMAGRAELRRGAADALEKFGVSTSAARTSSGTNRLHLELERAVAEFAGMEEAVLFAAGYLGMGLLLSGLREDSDVVVVQADAHSSILEAVRAWAPGYKTFDLEDLSTLETVAAAEAGRRIVVAAEGVSPLFGRVFPLREVMDLLDGRRRLVLLDDAHGFGVLGRRGRGTADHCGFGAAKDVVCCSTLSKAFGSFGGVAPVSAGDGDRIRKRSLVYQCSTPPPGPVCGAALAAFEYAAGHPELWDNLAANTRLLRESLAGLGLQVDDSPAAVVALTRTGDITPGELSDRLFEAGIIAPFTSYPGSPPDGMVRLAVTANHTSEQIGRLTDEIGKLL